MKKALSIAIFSLLLYSCSGHKESKPATALDTGRSFIRASLDGDFKTAQQLILKDTQNLQLFDSYKLYYSRLSDEKKNKYRAASYEINKYLDLDDSTTIINYSNSYMKRPLEIKIVNRDKEWQVDFKYTYSGNLPID